MNVRAVKSMIFHEKSTIYMRIYYEIVNWDAWLPI